MLAFGEKRAAYCVAKMQQKYLVSSTSWKTEQSSSKYVDKTKYTAVKRFDRWSHVSPLCSKRNGFQQSWRARQENAEIKKGSKTPKLFGWHVY